MNLINKILLESKQVGDVYHIMTIKSFSFLLYTDSLQSITNYISVTRDRNYNYIYGRFEAHPYKIVLDGDKLSNKYKIKPTDEKSWARKRGESELRIFGNKKKDFTIENIGFYIKEIWVNDFWDSKKKIKNNYNGLYLRDYLEKYLEKYPHIQIKIQKGTTKYNTKEDEKFLRSIHLINPKLKELRSKFQGFWYKDKRFTSIKDCENYINNHSKDFTTIDYEGEQITVEEYNKRYEEKFDLAPYFFDYSIGDGPIAYNFIGVFFDTNKKNNKIVATIYFNSNTKVIAKKIQSNLEPYKIEVKLLNGQEEYEKYINNIE